MEATNPDPSLQIQEVITAKEDQVTESSNSQ